MRKIKSKAKILIPGSGEEYGLLSKKDMPITENTHINPVNPYAVSKVAQDYISYVYFKSFGTKYSSCFLIFSDGEKIISKFLNEFFAYISFGLTNE